MLKPFARNYIPGSMSFSEGFLGPKDDVGYFMVVDSTKARRLIRRLLANGRKIERAELGLNGDWGINSGVIYDGAFHKLENNNFNSMSEHQLYLNGAKKMLEEIIEELND